MRSSHARPVCRPRLENLEDRLAPNNMLALLDTPSDWLGLGVKDFFHEDATPAALRPSADQRAPSIRSGSVDASPPTASSFEGAATPTPVHRPAESAARLEALAGLDDPLADQGAGTRSNPGVFPPNSRPFGRTYSAWSAAWWQWAYSTPAGNPNVHPLFQEGAVDLSRFQSGHVWFLGGVYNDSGTAIRTGTVPTGKALFFPVLNVVWDNIVCGGGDASFSVPELREFAGDLVDTAEDVALTVDGTPVDMTRFRVASPVFSYTVPADNLYQAIGCDVPARTVAPAVADGFYVMLHPLSVGSHTLQFQGTFPDFPFTLNITYNLTVTPH